MKIKSVIFFTTIIVSLFFTFSCKHSISNDETEPTITETPSDSNDNNPPETPIPEPLPIPDVSQLTAIYYDGKTHISWSNPNGISGVEIFSDGEKIGETNENFFITDYGNSTTAFLLKTKNQSDQLSAGIAITTIETDLPVIEVNTTDGEEPTCNYVSAPPGENGAGITNNNYITGSMRIIKNNEILYDSGEYEKDASGMKIKIRGNTSAYSEKKPYKIKLTKKADLLADSLNRNDKKYKDKEWLLIKDGTSLRTVVGMKTADLCGISWTPKFMFVNIILNNNYRGVYLLIESIKQSEMRCNVSDDGFVIENDAYWWNEDKYFQTTRSREFTFKYPDPDDITNEQIDYIKDYVQRVEDTLYAKEDYSDLIDEDSFVSWLLTHDILGTADGAGTNMYVTKYDNTSDSKLFMSTPWDYDSIYSMNNNWATVHFISYIFYYYYLTQYDSFKTAYKDKYDTVKTTIENDVITELNDLKAKQGNAINKSRILDAKRWGGNASTVENDISIAENWFSTRLQWLNTAINEL